MNEKKGLNQDQLQALLNDLVEKNKITARVADIIFKRVQQRKLELSKNDVLRLISTIQSKKYFKDNFDSGKNSTKEKKTTVGDNFVSANKTADSDSLQKLNDELSYIEGKIANIEEIQQHFFEETKRNEKTSFPPVHYNQRSTDEDMQPLNGIKNTPENVVVLMKWLQYLSDKLGQQYLSDILDYYVSINWITEDVRLDLMKYAKGITFTVDTDSKNHHQPVFTIDDHLQSFMFIQKLRGSAVHDDFLLKINTKLEKMGKEINGTSVKK
ncbi:MAG: FlaD/FlaE family flagellar protein [Thermoplasmatota archaeon]